MTSGSSREYMVEGEGSVYRHVSLVCSGRCTLYSVGRDRVLSCCLTSKGKVRCVSSLATEPSNGAGERGGRPKDSTGAVGGAAGAAGGALEVPVEVKDASSRSTGVPTRRCVVSFVLDEERRGEVSRASLWRRVARRVGAGVVPPTLAARSATLRSNIKRKKRVGFWPGIKWFQFVCRTIKILALHSRTPWNHIFH